MKVPGRKLIALILALAMALGVMSISAMADSSSTYTDVPQSFWGYEAITKWSTEQYNILRGYGDGRFGPNDMITAEQLAWINGRILGIADKDAVFTGAGSRSLTRAEAVATIAQAFGVEPISGLSQPFADNAAIPETYRGYVNAMKAAGYVKGVGDNNFDPNSFYTRAQALQVVYNMTSEILDKNATDIKAAKNVVIRKVGTTLSKSTIDGDLIIGQGVGDGNVILEDVTVKGQLLILGGGSNSIIVRGASKLPAVLFEKAAGQTPRLKVEGASAVGKVEIANSCSAIINGAVSSLVAAGGNTVQLQSAKVDSVSVEGAKVTLTVDGSSTVASATIAANDVKVQGSGKVNTVNATANAKSGVVVDTSGTKVTTASGAGDVKNSSGTVVAKGGSSATTSGGSTGSYSGGSSSGSSSSSGSGTTGTAITITYDKNGATSGDAPAEKASTAGASVKLAAKGEMAKDGCTFLGWATSKTAVEAQYAAGASVKFNADTTLFAVWKADVAVSSVAVSPASISGVKDDEVTLTATVLPGTLAEADKGVTWTIADGGEDLVELSATTGASVTVTFKEHDAGTTTITAKSAKDSSKSATVSVSHLGASSTKTNISGGTVTLSGNTRAWSSAANSTTDTITVTKLTVGTTEIDDFTDFTITYSGNTAVGTATVTVAAKSDNVSYYGSATATFTITAVAASATAPEGAADLKYTSEAQDLLSAGATSVVGGTAQYKVGASGTWQTGIPQATDRGTYKVYWRVVGDANHSNLEPSDFIEVSIAKGLASNAYALPPAAATLTYNGANQNLVTVPDGALKPGASFVYSTTLDGDYSATIPQGKNAGNYTVFYKVKGGTNYEDMATGAEITGVKINKKALTIAFADPTTDIVIGGATVTNTATVSGFIDGYTMQGSIAYSSGATGKATVDENSGEVTAVAAGSAVITATYTIGGDGDNYSIATNTATYTMTVTAKPTATYSTDAPAAASGWTYDGQTKSLLAATVDSEDGTVQYSVKKDDGEFSDWSTTAPTAEDAGTYTVKVKIVGDANHSDSDVSTLTSVTVSPKAIAVTVTPASITLEDPTPLTATIMASTAENVGEGTFTFTLTSGEAHVSMDGSGNSRTLTFISEGDATLSVSFELTTPNGNYTFTPKTNISIECSVAN